MLHNLAIYVGDQCWVERDNGKEGSSQGLPGGQATMMSLRIMKKELMKTLDSNTTSS